MNKRTISCKRIRRNPLYLVGKTYISDTIRAGNNQIAYPMKPIFQLLPHRRAKKSALASPQNRIHRAFRQPGTSQKRFAADCFCLIQPDFPQLFT